MLSEVLYRSVCVADPAQRRANVAHALSLGLPDVVQGAAKSGDFHIYANGPSAKVAALQWPCMALNGAIGLFRGQVPPTYWAAVDPQPMVADFVRDAPPWTTYLVGSRCDASVFSALADRSVELWHVADLDAPVAGRDQMPESPTITLMALFLAAYLGYGREGLGRIVVHGWDGCKMGDAAHAVAQDHDEAFVPAEFLGKRYVTTDKWMSELQSVPTVLGMLEGIDITATGDGLIASMVRHIRN